MIYPEYRTKDNYFLFSGEKVKRFTTIEENKINEGSRVILINLNVDDN